MAVYNNNHNITRIKYILLKNLVIKIQSIRILNFRSRNGRRNGFQILAYFREYLITYVTIIENFSPTQIWVRITLDNDGRFSIF